MIRLNLVGLYPTEILEKTWFRKETYLVYVKIVGNTSRILKVACKLIKNFWKNIGVQNVGILHWKLRV